MMPNEETDEVTLKQLLEEIRDTKKEIKNCLSASEARLLLEIQALKNKNEILEKENADLKKRLEKTERCCNKNNLVIFGLNRNSEITNEYICNEITRLLNVGIETSEISDCYTLGNRENSPIKVEFVSYLTKKLILKSVKLLKGTAVSIANDLTPQQRQENQKLRSFLLKARANSSEKSYIKGNRLVVGQRIYDLEELESSEEEGRTNSAPNTPTSENLRSATDVWPGSSTTNENFRKGKLITPHVATHKKEYINKKRTPPKGNTDGGMRLRQKEPIKKKE